MVRKNYTTKKVQLKCLTIKPTGNLIGKNVLIQLRLSLIKTTDFTFFNNDALKLLP